MKKLSLSIVLLGLVCVLKPVESNAEDILIYTKDTYGNNKFLGCFNCNQFSSDSIWNKFGVYGNRFNGESIWNEFGTFGNKFSSTSPWNRYSSNPPVLIDTNGGFYGYFTCNTSKSSRFDSRLMNVFCDNVDDMRENRDKWYNLIFR